MAKDNISYRFAIATNTKLDYIVYGPYLSSLQHLKNCCLFVNLDKDASFHHLVEDYFKVENMGVRSCLYINKVVSVPTPKTH